MKNNEIDNLQYMEWINYFPSFFVSSINNQIINNIANNEINKEDDENLINQEFKLIKNIEIPEKIKEFNDDINNNINIPKNNNPDILLNKNVIIQKENNNEFINDLKNLKEKIPEKDNKLEIKEEQNKYLKNDKNNNIMKEKNIKLGNIYRGKINPEDQKVIEENIYPKKFKYNYIKNIEKLPLNLSKYLTHQKLNYSNNLSETVSKQNNNPINYNNKNNNTIPKSKILGNKNLNSNNIEDETLRNKKLNHKEMNSEILNKLNINENEHQRSKSKPQLENNNKINLNLMNKNNKKSVFVEMALLKDVTYTSLYEWKILYDKRDPKIYNYENKSDNYKSQYFSSKNEPIDIQKPYNKTKNCKGLPKVKFLDENNILQSLDDNENSFENENEKFIKKDFYNNIYFMRKKKKVKSKLNKNDKNNNNIVNGEKYNIHKDFIRRVEKFQTIN